MSTNVPLMDGLEPDDRTAVTAALARRSYTEGADILTQGEYGTDFFVILAGTVAVIRGREQTNELGAGDFFGELAALNPGPGYALTRNATIRAVTEVEVGVIDEASFDALVRSRPAFRDAIYAQMPQRQGDA
jgi:CRP-like cAMP-binding protein